MGVVHIAQRALESPTTARVRVAEELLAEAMATDGGLIVVRGLRGTGVSRMLRNFIEQATARGFEVAAVRPDDFERDLRLSTIDRIYFEASWLRNRHPRLGDDVDALTAARALVTDTLAAEPVPLEAPPARMLVINGLEVCDETSAVALRYAIPRLIRRGVAVVIGDHICASNTHADQFAALAAQHATDRLLVLDDLCNDEIVAYVRERTGRCIGLDLADRIRLQTAGRFAALAAYVDALDLREHADAVAIRSLPRTTSARVLPRDPEIIASLPSRVRLAAEMCAIARKGVDAATFVAAAEAHGIERPTDAPADNGLVVWNPLVGELLLVDPLAADDLIALADADRLRDLHRFLAEASEGVEAELHRLASLSELDAAAAAQVVCRARDLEAFGDPESALKLLEVAIDRVADGDAKRDLLVAFGRIGVRNRRSAALMSPPPVMIPRASTDTALGHLAVWYRSLRPGLEAEAAAMRREYLAGDAIDLDHKFLRADIALLDFLEVLRSARSSDESAEVLIAGDSARAHLEDVAGCTPHDPDLAWLDTVARLVFVDALRTLWCVRAGEIRGGAETITALADGLASRAHELPTSSPDRADVLTVAAALRADLDDLDVAAHLIADAEASAARASRPTQLPGTRITIAMDVALRRGQWDAVEERLKHVEPIGCGRVDQPLARAQHFVAALLAAHRGDIQAAEHGLAIAKVAASPGFVLYAGALPDYVEAVVVLYRDGPEAALRVVDRVEATPSADLAVRMLPLRIELLAHLHRLDDLRDAADSYVVVAQSHLRPNNAQGHLAEAYSAHLEGDTDRAAAAALAAIERSHSPMLAARAHLLLAEVASEQPCEQAEVLARIEAARQAFDELGAVEAASDCERIARERREAAAERLQSLSERERDVATLAATGAKNREIAASLHISEATVAFHMTNVLSKLGLSSRLQVGDALGEAAHPGSRS